MRSPMTRLRPLLLPILLVILCIGVFAPLTQAFAGHYWLHATALLMGLTTLLWNLVAERKSDP